MKFRHGAANDMRYDVTSNGSLPSPMPVTSSTANIVYMDGHADGVSAQYLISVWPTEKESTHTGENIRALKAGIIDTKGQMVN